MFVLKDIPKSRVSTLKTIVSVVLGASYSSQWYADVPRLGPLAQLIYEVPDSGESSDENDHHDHPSSESNGVPVGAIRCALDPYNPVKDGPADTRPRVYIMVIAVLAPFRGLGAGTMMLNHIVEHAKQLDAKAVYLHVRATDTDSQQWYSRRGFVETGRVPGYYRQTGGDAFIYTLDL
ncbi:uncharacterized protein SAPINGB_P004213 [Magnusiomyces paraingens]|uniref:N-acetyltransferase domain-containing protein n=1 Tax=Magnusiomyces paraingens TaxID=2606893 RepID=A0A5E8BUD0_9ASCO|nr:uncharacterized protein SAPINGB_P004213 [Saprochaete ingens]VVT54711.1 unnamed protein product [Saprochaete ingens]